MEDLNRDVQGVDVRGLVAWDDGLSAEARERQRVAAEEARVEGSPVNEGGMAGGGGEEEEGGQQRERRRRPLKKWLGIW